MHAWMVVSVEDDGGMDIWLSCTEGATPESPSAALPNDASLSCCWGAWRLSGVLRLKLCAAREMVFCISTHQHGDLNQNCMAESLHGV